MIFDTQTCVSIYDQSRYDVTFIKPDIICHYTRYSYSILILVGMAKKKHEKKVSNMDNDTVRL